MEGIIFETKKGEIWQFIDYDDNNGIPDLYFELDFNMQRFSIDKGIVNIELKRELRNKFGVSEICFPVSDLESLGFDDEDGYCIVVKGGTKFCEFINSFRDVD
jgi:hypothetical protein